MVQPHTSGDTIAAVKARIRSLYETTPRIRINVAIAHSKVVQDADVTIVGVYQHVFCVEETSCGTPQRHTFQYADLLTGRIEIIQSA